MLEAVKRDIERMEGWLPARNLGWERERERERGGGGGGIESVRRVSRRHLTVCVDTSFRHMGERHSVRSQVAGRRSRTLRRISRDLVAAAMRCSKPPSLHVFGPAVDRSSWRIGELGVWTFRRGSEI